MTEEDNQIEKKPNLFIVLTVITIILFSSLLFVLKDAKEDKADICHALTQNDKSGVYSVKGIEKCCYEEKGKLRCKEWKEFSQEEESLVISEVKETGMFLNLTI